MLRVGITGAHGRIGSELCLLGGIPLECDITNLAQVEKEISRVEPNVIIHCAGLSDVDECQKDWKKAFDVNVRGTANVVEFGKRVILLSSDHVFNGKKGKYSEKDKFNTDKNTSSYALSKIGAESVMQVYLGGKIIRLSTVFDPYFCPSLDDGVPTFIKRSYGYIKHIARGIWYAANNYDKMPKILNIAGTQLLSMYEFSYMYFSVFGFDNSYLHPRDIPDDTYVNRPFKAGLSVKLAKRLGVPLYSALEGLLQMKEDLNL